MPNPDSFYSPEAYHPERIPDQPPAEKQPWLRRFGSMRLPWGNTQDIFPASVLISVKPVSLRRQEEMDRVRDEQKSCGEYKPKPFEHIDLHDRLDNERIRHAQFSASSKLWIYMQAIGKGGIIITSPFVFLSCFIGIDFEKADWWRFF
ncbi:MAG: hypothetical protein ACN6P1_22615 [Pseudomonas sp.]|uniref:hypothetical protein n=1 Tax=Pseudomonas sp. TaxID=306 RepID=UPI003D1461CF